MVPGQMFEKVGFFFVACCFVIVAETAVKNLVQSSPALNSLVKYIPPWVFMAYTFLTASYLAHVFFLPDFHKAGFIDILLNGFLHSLRLI